MEGIDGALRVLEDRVFLLDQTIRRQAASGFADAHRAAGRVEPHAAFPGRGDLVVDAAAVRLRVQDRTTSMDAHLRHVLDDLNLVEPGDHGIDLKAVLAEVA